MCVCTQVHTNSSQCECYMYSMRHEKGYTPLVTVAHKCQGCLDGLKSRTLPTGAGGSMLSSANGADGNGLLGLLGMDFRE